MKVVLRRPSSHAGGLGSVFLRGPFWGICEATAVAGFYYCLDRFKAGILISSGRKQAPRG